MTMEVSMVPSQFLNVVLEEDNVSSSSDEDYDTAYPQKRWSPTKQNESDCNNKLNEIEIWDLTKHLPKALLAECTVEISRSPLNQKEKPRSPCFDARVSPIFTKPSLVRPKQKIVPSDVQKSESTDESMDVQDLLTGVEAVYSDDESNKGYEEEEEDSDEEDVDENIEAQEAAVSIFPVKVEKTELIKPKIEKNMSNMTKFSYQCEHCPNVYSNRGALWQHSVATHSIEKTCECKICGRKFYRNCSLALHLKSHSDEEYCSCKECGKSFTRLINLERHMKVHAEVEQFPCQNCDKVFKDKSNLLRHAIVHSAPKMFPCDVCHKSYKSQDHLDIHHQTSHASDTSLLTCSTCGDTFNNFSELIKHDSTHSVDKPYHCRFCGKSYSQKSILRKHLIIHTGERLTCSICGIDFTQKSSLLRHVKRMHQSTEPVEVPVLLDCVSGTDTQ